MRVHITNPNGFLGQYLCAEAFTRGYSLESTPQCADALVLAGWRYSDPDQSVLDAQKAIELFGGQTVVGIGTQAELWEKPGSWSDYAAAKIKAREAVLGSRHPIKSWVRLSSIAGRGMTRGKLVMGALAAIRLGEPMVLQSTGQERVCVCDVRRIARNILDFPESGTHIRNGWGERASVVSYLDSWCVEYRCGTEEHNSTPMAFDDRDWNGWIDVGFTPEDFENLRHNYSTHTEIA